MAAPDKTEKKIKVAGSDEGAKRRAFWSLFRSENSRRAAPLPGVFSLFARSLGVLYRNWKVFLGIVLIYGLFNALLIQSFSAAGNVGEIKSILDELFTGSWGKLAGGLTVFTYLLGSSSNTASPSSGTYQLILTLVISLAVIWTLRQLYAGHAVRVRDAFYRGMTPIIQFVLVIVVVILQLLPLTLGTLLYSTVTANGIAATALESLVWALLAVALSAVSLYWISSSLFAVYIVTLPDMTPMKALRSAKQLVAGRRLAVIGRVLFLPIALLVLAVLIVMPVILFATPLAVWAFFALTMVLLPLSHSYMYALYRSLL